MSIGRSDMMLLALLGGSGETPGSRADWEEVLLRSIRHGVTPLLYARLSGRGEKVPEEVMNSLRRLHLESAAAAAGLTHHLGRALAALAGAGIDTAVLKGAHLGAAVYESPALRTMQDVDLMVRREDLGKAQRVLLDAGYPPHGETLPIDIHWDLTVSHSAAPFDVEGIWRRAVAVEIAGAPALVLSPEDLLLYVCAHLSLQHLFRSALRPLLDVREILLRHGHTLDWEAVAARARQWNIGRGVHLSLLLARDLVGAAVPAGALPSLQAGGFDDETREWAVGEIFTDGAPSVEREFSPYFWQLWKRGPVREKLGNLQRLLFPSRETISQKYPSPVDSGKTPLLYALRTAQHLGDYAGVTWRMLTGDGETRRTADEVNRAIAMRERLTSL